MLRIILAIGVLLAASGYAFADKWWAESYEPSPRPAISSQQNQPQSPRAQDTSRNDQRGTEKFPFVVKLDQPTKTQSEADDERAQRDEKAAYDRSALFLTLATVVVAFLTFGAIVVQAYFLWRAVKVSEVAATAAKASADAVVTQLRAYAFITAAKIYGFEQDGPLRLQIRLSNRGQTPAYELIHEHGFTIGEASKSRVKGSLWPPGPRPPFSKATLAPGVIQEAFIDVPTRLSPEAKAAIRDGTHALFAYGEIRYKDAFGKSHTSTYRMMYGGGPPIINDQLTICEEGNYED